MALNTTCLTPRNGHALKLDRSKALFFRAQTVDAFARAIPTIYYPNHGRIGGYPLYTEKARGCHIWDVDGNKYVDFLLGHGSVVLGHGDKDVSRAVRNVLRNGPNPTFMSQDQVELAETILSTSLKLESVVFLKTGSDATGAAVRLARSITGRRIVLRWGLHGWHDWCSPKSKGVSDHAKAESVVLTFNNPLEAKLAFSKYGDRIACVIVMPFEVDLPESGYLHTLRNLCKSHGSIFILDEIRTGFRISCGGAQQIFDIEADLVTYGKALGNGYAISVLAGKNILLDRILDVEMTSTFYRNHDSIAAALACLRKIIRLNVPSQLENLGTQLMNSLTHFAKESGVPAIAVGHPSMPFIRFNYGSPDTDNRALIYFCNAMLKKKILLSPFHHWFICQSMTPEIISATARAARSVFREMNANFLNCNRAY